MGKAFRLRVLGARDSMPTAGTIPDQRQFGPIRSEGNQGADVKAACFDQGSVLFDTTKAAQPIVAFTFAQRGAMAGVSLNGATFTRLEKE